MCSVQSPLEARSTRSVLDFETSEQLHDALREAVIGKASGTTSYSLDSQADWVLNGFNPDSTQRQTLEQEYHRLLTLKSYDLLDIESDQTLERITAMTARVLHCPIAYVGTMDLGRYNILAGKGLGTLKNVCRKGSFCEHVIQSTEDVVVFGDSSEDPYMKENWFVTADDGPKTRFYASAKLIVPDDRGGTCVLGTLCVIDQAAHPEGLSLTEKQNLCELADMVSDYLVQRRKEKLLGNPAQHVASVVHDLITPLTGIDSYLSSLKGSSNLTDNQREQLEKATRCASVAKVICRGLVRHAVEPNQKTCLNGFDDENDKIRPDNINVKDTVKVDDIIEKLSAVMEHHPKQVPLVLSVDPDVPKEFVSRGLILFRSALNLLTRACRITNKGSICFRISHEKDDSGGPMIRFECQDTGPNVPLERYPELFHQETNLAQHMISLGGDHAYQPQESPHQGSVFWFSIPLVLPQATITKLPYDTNSHGKSDTTKLPPFPSIASERRRSACNGDSLPVQERTKTALVIEDTLVVRKFLSRCLSKLGFEVTQAENGFVGLQKLKETMYDLCLCDFLMPVLDGVDCVQQFRAWEAKHRLVDFQQHIVGISAHCQSNDIQVGMQAGMNDFRAKPITIKHLEGLAESSVVKEAGRKVQRMLAKDGSASHCHKDDNEETTPMPMFNCLIGAETHSNYSRLIQALNPKKWKVVTAYDGTDVLELLKLQNWDLVVLDDDLPRLSGTRCAMRFRDWEKCHRINRQRNMVLASAYLEGSKIDASKILLPYGFEHLIEKPYHACENFIHQVEEQHTTILTGSNIIAH